VVAFTLAWGTNTVADLGSSTSGRISLLKPDSKVDKSDVLSLTCALIPFQIILAVGAVSAMSLTSFALPTELSIVVVALSVSMMLHNSSRSILYGLRRYRQVLIADLGMAVLQIVALGALLVAGSLTAAWAVSVMAAGFASAAIFLFYRSGAFSRKGQGPLTARWSGLISDGVSPMAGALAMFFALRLNRLVLATAFGSRSVGLFAVAVTVPETLRNISVAVGQVIADRARSGADSVETSKRHVRLFVAGNCVLLAVGTAAGWLLLPTLFGSGFTEAREILIVLCIAEVAMSVHLMGQALLVGFGRPSGIGLPQVVGAAAMIVLNLAMIPRWGIEGAAWASLIGFLALGFTSAVWASHELGQVKT
jgi:O-antigen/teichoic acid export membrane protein